MPMSSVRCAYIHARVTMGEPGRTKAYHEDLRWRIVWQRILNNSTIREISASLCVASSTVWRILDRFERTGCVVPNMATARAQWRS